ncbi:monocarboxylate transporter 12 [Tribolium castaneum]|uniref:Monocarboxylate transporter 5-like protein n=1 Tax=Tribolium castaneum TaxID=7070 RepID=A0A139WH66_TRICA|nr:PREDICTED: monocarboxylate transporter 12 [Tribolium castaneum]XP_969630.1 PREDICTED: monocarboxylate transporter 12 [Tribolium castaneum]KYB27338.1 Monocarboxylate transporter 5-like protein [Tribolium castaneum]|eukprot:XP_015836006.1 PREDICTED: monocarboxylate transporter 12 [Tribolium castaneum]
MSVGHQAKRQEDEEESDAPAPPDGGWGWMVVFGSFMIHIITDGVTYSFGVFYDEFLDYFQEGKAATAWVLSILVGVTLCSGPISSSFVNRWGCRPVTIAGAIIGSICMIISVFAQNVTTLYFTIGIGTGFGFGLIYLPAIVSVTTYFEKKRSLATGIAVCGSGFGTFIFAPIITRLLVEYGWRGAMLIIAGIVLECIVFGALFRPLETEEDKNLKPPPKITLKSIEAKVDLHVSEHNLQQISTMNGNGEIHRPHSLGHFSMPRGTKLLEPSKNISNGKTYEASRLALSQPMLALADRPFQHRYGSQNLRKHGPLDKPDVFYQGSLMNIPSYRSRLDLKNREEMAFLGRRQSSISYRRRHVDTNKSQTTMCGCIPCSQETKDTLKEMLDFSLFHDWIFILFITSNFLTSIGFNIPYVYIVPKAKSMNLSAKEASMLLSIIGFANTIGRIVLGYFSDKAWVNRLMVYNWCLTLCGIATTFSAFCPTFYTLALFASVFGFTIGAYVGLTSVILVDLLGLERLTNAFGLLLLFQGIASLIGPPMAGALYDATLSYDPGFYLSGITISLSGVILFFIPPIQRCKDRKQERNPTDI